MNRTIFTILLALVSVASQAQGNSYTIRGTVDDPDVTVVYVEQEGRGYETLDSAIVTNGEFTMKGKVDKPTCLSLSQETSRSNIRSLQSAELLMTA